MMTIPSTRSVKKNQELLTANNNLATQTIDSVPVYEFNYNNEIDGAKKQVGILVEDTLYSSKDTADADAYKTSLELEPFYKEGFEEAVDNGEIKPLDSPKYFDDVSYQIKTGEKDDIIKLMQALLDKVNKGQNINSSVGLLLKAIQELSKRLMYLERRVVGKDFVEEVGLGSTNFAAGELNELNLHKDKGINNEALFYGINRLVRALLLEIFGKANPLKSDDFESDADDFGESEIDKLRKAIEIMENSEEEHENSNEVHNINEDDLSITNTLAIPKEGDLKTLMEGILSCLTWLKASHVETNEVHGFTNTAPANIASFSLANAGNLKEMVQSIYNNLKYLDGQNTTHSNLISDTKVGHVQLSNEEPEMNETADSGTSVTASRSDHIHPSDENKTNENGWDAGIDIYDISEVPYISQKDLTLSNIINKVLKNLRYLLPSIRYNTGIKGAFLRKFGQEYPNYGFIQKEDLPNLSASVYEHHISLSVSHIIGVNTFNGHCYFTLLKNTDANFANISAVADALENGIISASGQINNNGTYHTIYGIQSINSTDITVYTTGGNTTNVGLANQFSREVKLTI